MWPENPALNLENHHISCSRKTINLMNEVIYEMNLNKRDPFKCRKVREEDL